MRPLETHIRSQLLDPLRCIEEELGADVVAIFSPILFGLEHVVRIAIETIPAKRGTLAILLDTPGGVVEVVERMVNLIRKHYNEVTFIIPDCALSAGTVFVMSGDRILMDYFSCLGPIDPQIQREDGRLVPALSYLKQYERLKQKAEQGTLNSAEFALLTKLDLAELHQYEQARDLSIDLLKDWLSRYKFKNWTKTETRGAHVTDEMKRERARQIADMLNDTDRWRSHARGISMEKLKNELNLKIDDFSANDRLAKAIADYTGLLKDYMGREKLVSFVHTEEYF